MEIHDPPSGVESSENESDLRPQRSKVAEEPWTAEEDEVLVAARQQGIRYSALGSYLFPSRSVRAMGCRCSRVIKQRLKLKGHACKSNKTHHGTEANGLYSADSAPETNDPQTESHTEGLSKHSIRTTHAEHPPNNSERVAQLKGYVQMTSEKQSYGCESHRSSPSLISRYEAFLKESGLTGLSVRRAPYKAWTKKEDETLIEARERGDSWTRIRCDVLPRRQLSQLWYRYSNLLELRRQGVHKKCSAGRWNREEDQTLLGLRKRGMTFLDIKKYYLPARSLTALKNRWYGLRDQIEREGALEADNTTSGASWSYGDNELLQRPRSQDVPYAEIQRDHLPEKTTAALQQRHRFLRKRSEKSQGTGGCGDPQTRKRLRTVMRTEKHSEHDGGTECR